MQSLDTQVLSGSVKPSDIEDSGLARRLRSLFSVYTRFRRRVWSWVEVFVICKQKET